MPIKGFNNVKFSCSLDQQIKVKLTPRGKARLQALAYCLSRGNCVPINLDDEGYLSVTLWEFITYFNFLLHDVENNEIYFEVIS